MDRWTVGFWHERIRAAMQGGKGLREAISDCGSDVNYWKRIDGQAQAILAEHVQPGDKVLDVGCGLGDLSALLPPDVVYVGVDFVPEFVAEAERRFPSREFVGGDLHDLSRFADRSFDWVIARGGTSEVNPEMRRVACGAVLMSFSDPVQADVARWG